MVSAGMTCVKYLLFCFNLLFALSGIAILIVGALIQSSFHHYSDFVDASFWSAPVLLIVIGAIAFVIAFFGCCGAVKESNCMIITFSVFLIGIFILELSAGIAGYLKHGELSEILENNFNKSMTNYSHDPETRGTWDILQGDLHCCGMNGPNDWEEIFHNSTLPRSCCNETELNSVCLLKYAYPDGCMPTLLALLQEKALILGGVGVGIAFVQLLGVAFACCLAKSIRDEYETV